MGEEIFIVKYSSEIALLEQELRELIEYDEWAATEHGETRVDYYWTAVNLIKAGYRKHAKE